MLIDFKTFYSRLDNIRHLPTLPTIVSEVNGLLQDSDTTLEILCRTIEKDQAIVSKLLSLVNSAFYGFQSKVDSLSNALVLLGFNTIRNAILSLSIIESFSDVKDLEGFEIADFWHHSLEVAVISRKIAEHAKAALPDSSFVAGLLHDTGKVLMLASFQDLFRQIWQSVRRDNLTFLEAEKRLLPVQHPMIGAYLAKKWQLPSDLIQAVKYHHAPQLKSEENKMQMVIYLADRIVNSSSETQVVADQLDLDIDTVPWAAALMDSLAEWYPPLQAEVESACAFFFANN
ncbi:hypothetical protein D1BOALGB6SA_912 [Olavius sp. associated proteobacterium Delta 1]|nr:hypothetical protein D1BOALGB6SA_912 [Olavius sp. associated proteobacterium Delta 1]